MALTMAGEASAFGMTVAGVGRATPGRVEHPAVRCSAPRYCLPRGWRDVRWPACGRTTGERVVRALAARAGKSFVVHLGSVAGAPQRCCPRAGAGRGAAPSRARPVGAGPGQPAAALVQRRATSATSGCSFRGRCTPTAAPSTTWAGRRAWRAARQHARPPRRIACPGRPPDRARAVAMGRVHASHQARRRHDQGRGRSSTSQARGCKVAGSRRPWPGWPARTCRCRATGVGPRLNPNS